MPNTIVIFDNSHPKLDLVLKPGVNLRTGENELTQFGKLSTLETDLLVLASAIYASDIAFKRGRAENITRSINLTIPVVNITLFRSMVDEIRFVLYRLTCDSWKIQFTQRPGTPEQPSMLEQNNDCTVLLFSGGLDSFAGAILLGDKGEKVQLVSHITANHTISSAQEQLFNYLAGKYITQFSRIPIHVSGNSRPQSGYPFPGDDEREETQRARSFLFLSLAAIVARKLKTGTIIMIAENGQTAIHLPLTAARIGAFSTHTAHPQVVSCMGNLLSNLLGYSFSIENPFLYKTKAEVIGSVIKDHLSIFGTTVSCWMASRLGGAEKHCGICIPCLVRRIAAEYNGYVVNEYKRDIFSENLALLGPDDDGKRNLIELAIFVKLFETKKSQAEIESLYPELLDDDYFDPTLTTAMYRRFAHEARTVFNKYPNIASSVQ